MLCVPEPSSAEIFRKFGSIPPSADSADLVRPVVRFERDIDYHADPSPSAALLSEPEFPALPVREILLCIREQILDDSNAHR